jgi:undecaprenyl diphosphate synthase
VLADFVGWCADLGVGALTVFAFSTENWRRDAREVGVLMDALVEHCARLKEDARRRNVRVRALMTSPHRVSGFCGLVMAQSRVFQ